jgi:hemoglobin
MQSINLSQYNQLGGEKGVKRLVDRFYDLMDERDDVSELRALHAKSLKVSRQKLFLFLSGWLGGPSLYIEKYGHPRLRSRHFPFTITSLESEQWMKCMTQALQEQITDDELLLMTLISSFRNVADHMRNTAD